MNAAASLDMPLDLARRTLTQRRPLVPASAQARADAFSEIAPDVRELATGFDFSSDEVRDALVAQQLQSSQDLWVLANEETQGRKAALSLAAQQTMARAVSAAKDFSKESLARKAFEGLPAELRQAIGMEEAGRDREAQTHRPR
jgi:predicted component of type VI protein secretion system